MKPESALDFKLAYIKRKETRIFINEETMVRASAINISNKGSSFTIIPIDDLNYYKIQNHPEG